MYDILQKLAEAAAGGAPQASGGQPAAGAPDPNDPNAMMMEQPDPIEEDNQRLQNILQNLELRKEIVEAQSKLEKLLKPKRRRYTKDPDKPRKTPPRGQGLDVSTASAMTDIVKKTPKIKRDMRESGNEQERHDAKQRTGVNSGSNMNTAQKQGPLPGAGEQ
jgi:hypothetical protein